MSNKEKFENKYSFDLRDELKNTNEIKENFNFEKLNLKENKTENIPFKVEILINNPEDVKKIKIDSKTYLQNLKRKVILNFKLSQLFIENFYRDEFNYSRKSSYVILGFPSAVLLIFKIISPYNPFFGMITKMSLLGTIMAFGYYLNIEMNELSRNPRSDLGIKIRKIKNELVLYNPLANPVLDSDLKENKNI